MNTTTYRPLWQRVVNPYARGYDDGRAGFDRDYCDWWTAEEENDYDAGYRDGVMGE